MAKRNQKKIPAWIIVLCVLCYPIGLGILFYWMAKRLGTDPANYKKNSKPVKIIAWVLIFIGVFYLISAVSGNVESDDPGSIVSGAIIVLVIFCGGGFAMLRSCKKHKKLADIYEKYAPCILGGKESNLDKIAAIVGVSSEQATEEVQKLIDADALKDAYIDRQSRKIVIPSEMPPAPEPPKPKVDNRPRIAVVCPHCGGANKVIAGQKAACEYCDMPLK